MWISSIDCHGAPKKWTVLIVEDEPVAKRALARLLSWSGFTVKSVASGEEALEFALHERRRQRDAPLIVLADFNLPGINGLELIRQLEAHHVQLRPILITATGDEKVREAAFGLSVPLLRKPINVRQLMTFLLENATGETNLAN